MIKNYNKRILVIAFVAFSLSFSLVIYATQINPPVIYDNGGGNLRTCPSFDCNVSRYGAFMARTEILEASGDWYKVNLTERGYFDNNANDAEELPSSQWVTYTGWMHYSVFPEDVLIKVGRNSSIKEDEILGTGVLNKQSVVRGCPSTNSCTVLTYLDAGTNLQIIGLDETGVWYRVKVDDPVLAGWDKWIQASNFTDESRNIVDKNSGSVGTATTSSQPTSMSIGGWLKNTFNQIHSYSKVAPLVLMIFALIILFYLIGKYHLFSKVNLSWLKNRKTIAGASILCIVVVFFLVSNHYQKRETELKDFLVSQQKTLQDTNKSFDTLNQKYNQESSQRIAQEKIAKEIISRLENKVNNASATKTNDLASVISQWSGIIAKIECEFTEDQQQYISQGSGTALGLNGQTIVLSNRHVLVPDNITPSICRTKIPSSALVYSGDDIRVSVSGADWAVLHLNDVDQQIRNITAKQPAFCQRKPSIGDEVVILGYPSIGAKTTITATEGIVAGYDGDFFITSAKVEQGNSGGAAILLKDNCLLGIPTFAQVGKIEALARILDISTIIK